MGSQIIDNGQTTDPVALYAALGQTKTKEFIDRLIEALLIVLLIFMPFSLGSVQAWSEEFVIFMAGLIVTCFCCKLVLHPRERIARTWVYLPLAIFVFIGVLQLIPMPKAVISIVSPNTVALRTELLGDLPGSKSHLDWMPLSLYPAATRHDLRLVLAVAGVFVVVLNVFRETARIKRLLWAVALIGAVVAAITLGQNIFGNGKIYWFISTPNSQGCSGPFINHSNYGQFMNLSIGASLGLLIVRLREVFAHRRITAPRVFDYIGSSAARRIWLLVGIISICLATVFLSLTRGGMVSMIAAMTFTVLILARTKSIKGQWWLFVAVALLSFSCILYTGFDAVCERLATLRNLGQANSGRIQILKDIAAAWTRFPLVGTGLGTHSYVYPMSDHSYIVPLAAHAENEYAQALEETGLLGLGGLVVFGIMIFKQYFKCTRNKSSVACSAAYGLGFGIIAILVQSMTDFGQHLPANGILTATFCAILLVLAAKQSENVTYSRVVIPYRSHRLPHALTIIAVCLVWFWAMRDANQYRIAEGYWSKAKAIARQLAESKWQGSEHQYGRLIRYARQAAQNKPDSVLYRYWLNVYRYKALCGDIDPYNEVSISEEQMPQVHDIVDQLHQVCLLCPTYGPAYSMAGQIERFILDDKAGSAQIKKGFRLARNDPFVCFLAGCPDASEGDVDSAEQKFARAIKLDGRLLEQVVTIYIDHLSRPDLAVAAAGEDIRYLYHVLNAMDEAQYTDYSEQICSKMIALLEEKSRNGTAEDWEHRMLGICYKRQGRNEAAIECYRKALRLRYAQVNWRFELADLLAKCDKAREAMDEAKICLQLRPGFTAAKNLLEDCSVHPSVLKEAIERHN